MYINEVRAWTGPGFLRWALLLPAALLLGYLAAAQAWLAMAAVSGAVLLAISPAWLWLGIYFVMVPFDDVLALPPPASSQTLTSLVALVAMFALLSTELGLERLRLPEKPALWLLLFVVWSGCTTLWASDHETATGRLMTMISLCVFYLIATCCRFVEKEIERMCWLGIGGGAAAAAVALLQFHAGIFYRNEAGRASLVFGDRATDPNILAAALLLPLALALGEFLGSKEKWKRVLLLGCALLIGAGILATTSRGALTAVAVLVLFLLVKSGVNLQVLVPLGFLATAMLMAPELLMTRLQQSQTTGGAGRLYIWQTGMAAWSDHPVAGVGLENFKVVYDDYAGLAMCNAGLARPAHNVYLQIAVETGAVGLLLFLVAVFSHLRLARRSERQPHDAVHWRLVAIQSGAVGVLVSAFFLGLLWTKSFWMAWILLALASSSSRLMQSTQLSRRGSA